MTHIRKLLISGDLLILGAMGGFVVGYFKGYGGGVGHPAIASAFGTMASLKSLREGRPDEAIRQLELTPDVQLVQAAAYKRSPFLLTKAFEGDDKSITTAVAACRSAYPSTFPEPEVRHAIAEALENGR